MQATYQEASAKCERDGMKLAVLDGEEEMKNIVDYLSYTGKSFIIKFCQCVDNIMKKKYF